MLEIPLEISRTTSFENSSAISLKIVQVVFLRNLFFIHFFCNSWSKCCRNLFCYFIGIILKQFIRKCLFECLQQCLWKCLPSGIYSVTFFEISWTNFQYTTSNFSFFFCLSSLGYSFTLHFKNFFGIFLLIFFWNCVWKFKYSILFEISSEIS